MQAPLVLVKGRRKAEQEWFVIIFMILASPCDWFKAGVSWQGNEPQNTDY